MVMLTCEALVRQALDLLDRAGEGASPVACNLQAALDALDPSADTFDIDAAADALLYAPDHGRLKCFSIA